ncbi:MAG TPA: Hsp70 family protein [Candidatus Acidoferrales bacterium]|nr:Hsp70 family protein [Candidatus Acidoferrales bacterium]
MARLGIDFGTTNTVVVCADRGRYSVIPHATETAIGRVVRDVFPSVLAYEHTTGRFLYGADAERCLTRPGATERYTVIHSIKRLLRDYIGGSRIGFDVHSNGFDTAEMLRGFAAALRQAVLSSGLFALDELLQAVITWPANANGAQRYVTRTCFKEAGFDVIDTLNEPTAAAIEFADRMVHGNRTAARKVSASVAIFDLGGGTFDASLVKINGAEFTVLDAAGIEELGGDDLDDVLARMFAHKLKVDFDALTPLQRAWLRRHACQQKESIASGTVRSLTLVPPDIGLTGEPCTISVSSYFKQLTPVIAPAVDMVWSLVNGAAATAVGVAPETLDAVYLVGGSSKLPLVAKLIAARFPKVQLVMTDKPFTATAMGAAIHSAERVTLHDILSRHFGVLRLADHGTREYFAPIFAAGTRLPPRGGPPIERHVEYSPRHNIGHLRYFECAGVDAAGRPAAGVRAWSDVLFPYDPSIPVEHRLALAEIHRREDLTEQSVRETYSCDSDGVITVRLRRRTDGQTRCFEIFRN